MECSAYFTRVFSPRRGHDQEDPGNEVEVDKIAQSLVPSHYQQDNVKAILTTADGNCLFNAASLALCGCEKLSVELRVRTAIELATNTEYYKNHPVVMNCGLKTESGKPWAISSIYYATILGTLSSKVFEKSRFHVAILNEIMTTTQNKSFSGLLQIMGLASAIGCQIHMIYPDTKHRMLSLLNGVYSPREVSSINNHRSIVIMWTSKSGWPDRSKMFTVDHFVPMLPTLTTEEIGTDSGWTLIKNQRKRPRQKKRFPF